MSKVIILVALITIFSCKKRDSFLKLRDIELKIYSAETIKEKKVIIDEFIDFADEYFHEICEKNSGKGYSHMPLGMQLQSTAGGLRDIEIYEYYVSSVKSHPALEKLMFSAKVDCNLE